MGHKKSNDLKVRVSDALHDSLYQRAQSLGMNKSEYVRYVVRKDLDNRSFQDRINQNTEKK